MPPVADRLRSAAEFRRVFREGKAVSTPHLVVHTAKSSNAGAGRYGLVVSRKVGGAVARNRARRQARAAIELAGGIRPGFDVVIVVKPGAALQVQELSKDLWQIMEGSGPVGRKDENRAL
ncbi:MAG: ribonuclease P protein component [Actinomycetota bacterium]